MTLFEDIVADALTTRLRVPVEVKSIGGGVSVRMVPVEEVAQRVAAAIERIAGEYAHDAGDPDIPERMRAAALVILREPR